MRWRDIGDMTCSVARALSVVGDRWTLLILRDAFLGMRRFDDLQADLGTTRHRLAPSAARTAISFCRAAARASRRLATLAHAMSNTNPTAPSNTRSACLT